MNEKGSKLRDYDEEAKLRRMAIALSNAVDTYEHIKLNQIQASANLKKAVQTSIKELCTAICKETD